jgi:hypothetical protein
MRIYISLLTLVISGYFFSCERKCSSYANKPLTGKIEEYFGVYKPGNWWVYHNKNGIKKDSIYISNFTDTFGNNKTTCENIEERKFEIINTYLVSGDTLYVIYNSGGNGIGVNFSFSKWQTQSAGFPQFIYLLDSDSIMSFPSPDNIGNNMLDSISLNALKYYNILIGKERTNTFYFAKNKGLIGWGNVLDTFNLVNFKIP